MELVQYPTVYYYFIVSVKKLFSPHKRETKPYDIDEALYDVLPHLLHHRREWFATSE